MQQKNTKIIPSNWKKFLAKIRKKSLSFFFVALFLLASISPFFYSSESLACACSCGVLNVGTSSLIPNCEGGTAFLQYDQMSQARNWRKEKKSAEENHDQKIATQTTTAGMQYMFSREFGVAIRIPYVTRYVKSVDHENEEVTNHSRYSDIGDIRLNGIYSGFSDDMSTGIIFGLKLPTGATSDKGFARNTQIGTGSTDSIIGAYHMGTFGEEGKVGYFLQSSWDRPFKRHRGYTPGYEISGATGVYYDFGKVGFAKKMAPIFQFTGVKKGKNSGWADASGNSNSGYDMAFFVPGIEMTIKEFKLYADVEFPIYRNVNGNQLAPQNLYKVILGYNF